MLFVGHRHISAYHYHPYLIKPYIYPVVGPTGKNLTYDTPGDHLHHRSIWYGHHDVNGVNFYYEGGGEGRVVHQEFLRWFEGDRPGFVARNLWNAPDGRSILSDLLELRFEDLGDGEWYLDFALTLVAEFGPVTMSDTKEAGLPLLRVADGIDELDGGRITAADGSVGEKETFGKRAPWVDYSGPSGNPYSPDPAWQGIAMFDHPSNPNHPPGLFTRSYGPISTREGFMWDGGCTMNEGDRLTLRTRFYIHRGDAAQADVAGHYQRYAEMRFEDGGLLH